MEKPGIPRFGSFKPKPKNNVEPTDAPSVRDVARHQSRRDDQRHSHERYEHQERVREQHGSRSSCDGTRGHRERDDRQRESHDCRKGHRKRSPDQCAKNDIDIKSSLTARQKTSNDTEESNLFLIDRRGDPKNVEYGGLHSYSIPAYRRTGYGNVIGTANKTKIDRETSTDKEVCLVHVRRRPDAKAPRLLTSKHGRGRESHYRFILPQENRAHDLESDYIDLRTSRKRRRSETSNSGAIDYRSLEGKAKAQVEDDDLASVDESGMDDTLDLAARQRNAVLSKQTKADPRDIESWLTLIEHQAQLVQPGKHLAAFTSSERRTSADLRLSMTGTALAHITRGMPGHERLMLVKLSEGSLIWDASKRSAQWEEALKLCPTSTLLWTKYLDHIQNTPNGFQFEACRDAYLKCLSMLATVARAADGSELALIAEVQIYVLLRYTSFVKDAGYSELCIAHWQALLEWSFHMPVALEAAVLADRISSFEEYWDSECPRMGERQARGWDQFYDNGAVDTRKPEDVLVSNSTSTSIEETVAREAVSSRLLCLPTTADDDAAVEDPFRCVLFSDIRAVLEHCNALTTSGPHILDAMLQCFGLPPVLAEAHGSADSISWSRDSHLANTAHVTGFHDFKDHQSTIQSRRETIESLLADSFPADLPVVGLFDNVLEQILTTHYGDGRAEYVLAYKSRYFSKLAPKAAKQLLKDHPASLRLYNAYALMLAATGEGRELQKSLQVWSTSIHMRAGLPVEEQDNVVFLWHSRLLCLHARDARASLASLMTICETSGDANTKHLKVQRELESGFDRMQLTSKYIHASLYADLLAWLAYLTAQTAIETALSNYQRYEDLLSSAGSSLGLEHLLQHKAKLIGLHISQKRPMKPVMLRSELEADLTRFPSNSDLLVLRDQLSHQDRLRELVKPTKSVATGPENIVQWSYKLAAELRRISDLASSGATKNSVRAHFANAVSSPDSAIKHAPALWMLWLTWEHSLAAPTSSGERTRSVEAWRRIKQVYLDGLRHIPWHKEFLLEGLQLFTSSTAVERAAVVSEAELRQWWDVLVERGLRIRYEID